LPASSTQVTGILDAMATLDIDAMLARFRERASAVKKRPLPPVAGEERQQFLQQAKFDYQDFAIIGDAEAAVEDGILTLRIDLRPPDQKS
jgi:limonene-1,2-epoxide hydrolase